MLHCIIHILETLLRLLRPAPPAYRVPPPVAAATDPGRRPGSVPERGLWLAMYGIDIRHCSNRGVAATA